MDLSAKAQSVYPDWWTYATAAASAKDANGDYKYLIVDFTSAAFDVARQEGRPLSFDQGGGLSTLFSIARTMEVKADLLTALADDAAITSKHISEAPYSRTLADQLASPTYKLVAEITYRAPDGTVITQWGTGFFKGAPPVTAGDMRDEAKLQFRRMLAKRDEQKNTGGELLAVGRTYLISI